MLAQNGPLLGANSVHGAQSVVARKFYSAFGRWSRIECSVGGKRRSYHAPTYGNSKQRSRTLEIQTSTRLDLQGQRRWGSTTGSSSTIEDTKESSAKVKAKSRKTHSQTEGINGKAGLVFLPTKEVVRVLEDAHRKRVGIMLEDGHFTSEEDAANEDLKHHGEVLRKVTRSEGIWRDTSGTYWSTEPPATGSQSTTPLNFDATTLEEFEKGFGMGHSMTGMEGHSTEELSSSVRRLMRYVPHPVGVITTTASTISKITDPKTSDISSSNYRGMTISSFTTVTLDPEPIISFNIRTPSSTLAALKTTRFFLLHLLSQNPAARSVAELFTKGNGKGGSFQDVFQQNAGRYVLLGPPTHLQHAGGFLPKLTLPAGVQGTLRCEILSQEDQALDSGRDGFIRVGDHTLVLARIVTIQPPYPSQSSTITKTLCYQNGEYSGTVPLV